MLLSIIDQNLNKARDIVQKGGEDAILRVEEILWRTGKEIMYYRVRGHSRKRKERLVDSFWHSNKVYKICRQAAEISIRQTLKDAVYYYNQCEPICIHDALNRVFGWAIQYKINLNDYPDFQYLKSEYHKNNLFMLDLNN